MNALPHPDGFHLQASEGWLLLGNLAEAKAELRNLRPASSHHPDTLEMRFAIAAREKAWSECSEVSALLLETAPSRPSAWVNCAFVLHELKRTSEACDALRTAQSHFPEEPAIAYNLACYSCALGLMDDSRSWLLHALAIGGEPLKNRALTDADLAPLWGEIRGL